VQISIENGRGSAVAEVERQRVYVGLEGARVAQERSSEGKLHGDGSATIVGSEEVGLDLRNESLFD
jgi:hypothetical protein